MDFTGDDVFIVVVDGVKIAKRQDATWVSLEPGRRVNSVAIGGRADLSERLVQTNSVENDPLRKLSVHRSS
jgi:hypothetical protein